jgi:hypothetical protein
LQNPGNIGDNPYIVIRIEFDPYKIGALVVQFAPVLNEIYRNQSPTVSDQ